MSTRNNDPRVFVGAGVIALILAGAFIFWITRGGYDELSSDYGRSRGPKGAAEPAGTGVLAGLFRKAGYRVRSVTRLSPRIDKAGVLVWFPNDFEAPSDSARQRLESWLQQGTGRTLIYVGRDYNPAQDYWRRTAELAPPERQEQFQREAAVSEARHQQRRVSFENTDGGWFTLDIGQAPKRIQKLGGPWAKDVDPAQAELVLDTRLVPPKVPPFNGAVTDLLVGDGEPLVREIESNGNRLIVVQNGSFLLNYPLVNHEHRKLAGRLVERCNTTGDVLLIESNHDPAIVNTDVQDRQTLFEFFELWPLNAIVVHAVLLGFVACMAFAPIFGRPKELPTAAASDFGRHVAALGRLLGGTGAREYAVQKLQQYRRRAQRGSGKSRLATTRPAHPTPPNTPA